MKTYRNSYLAYFLMYLFYYLSWSLFSTLISVYLMDKGYRPSQVSLVVSLSFFLSMLAQPFIGYLNDRFEQKKVIAVSLFLCIIGALCFLASGSILFYALSYSIVLLLINGTNPVLESIATRSPFSYGKIRIWGTIGYAMGSQLAGFIYDQVSPQAIYCLFIVTILLAVLGILGTDPKTELHESQREKSETSFWQLFKNPIFLIYILIATLFSGVMNTNHTYVPSLLEDSGLSVGLATSVVSIAVLCEAPLTLLSFLFMDRFKSKPLILVSMSMVALQCLIYALDIDLSSKILATLLAKHLAGMLFIMVNLKIVTSLVDGAYLITALALVQTGRNLGSILMQHIAGQILDYSSYANMYWVMTGVVLLAILSMIALPLPSGMEKKLFSR
ncbi:MFS transporter [Streptococcus loxodontisalivarius]|uniref:OHS family lactose permease-like MFS transporter n=1 Tax=Streptococcus loxodontisalivarius TaxID=1349415 RepID=A0ABS2PSU6_9STRE|nr:MFS transporter [Streptococcus loxodontisalivarius]MBM7642951.1 OHS family lactose permease-like MFS transporter [Streptococcus loxodontisalivarius]